VLPHATNPEFVFLRHGGKAHRPPPLRNTLRIDHGLPDQSAWCGEYATDDNFIRGAGLYY
jgi:hypothetical protein